MNNNLIPQIDALKALIEKAEENHRIAITKYMKYERLGEIREYIRVLKNNLQALSDKIGTY